MARSIWKGPFVDGYLLKKAETARASGRNEVIKIWSRRSTILPQFVGLTFGVTTATSTSRSTSPRRWSVTSSASSRRPAPSTATRPTRRRRGADHGQAASTRARSRTTRPRRWRACCASARRSSTSSRSSSAARRSTTALADLEFSRKRIAREVKKALESAIANAENNHDLDVDDLVVAEAFVGKALVMKRFHARAPRPRRPHREAVLEPHHRGSRSRSRSGVRSTDGSESQSDRSAPRHQPDLGLPLVRQQGRVRQAAARGHGDPRSPDEAAQAGRRLEDRHRAPAQEVPRHHPLGPSGRRDRQEGRRHREAAQARRQDDQVRSARSTSSRCASPRSTRRSSPTRSPSSSSAASRSAAP